MIGETGAGPNVDGRRKIIVSFVSAVPESVSSLSAAGVTTPRRRRITPPLSPREIEVLLAWIASDSKTEVCQKLYISPGTVNTHLVRIRDKYERAGRPAPTKAALMARALQDGYLDLDEI